MTKPDLLDLFEAWKLAELAWEQAYTKVCKPNEWPADVRYTAKAEGKPGTDLRTAYDAYVAARKRYMAKRDEEGGL